MEPRHVARLELLIDGDRYVLRKLATGHWRVGREASTRVYLVGPGDPPTCDCNDFRRRHAGHQSACKHIRALVAVGLVPAPAAR
jgi:hypothetical protein